MTIEEKRRELFEAYIKTANAEDYATNGEEIFDWNGATYSWTWVNFDWMLWNAALDAVVISLPPLAEVEYDAGYTVLEQCRDAIESTDLGLKVLP